MAGLRCCFLSWFQSFQSAVRTPLTGCGQCVQHLRHSGYLAGLPIPPPVFDSSSFRILSHSAAAIRFFPSDSSTAFLLVFRRESLMTSPLTFMKSLNPAAACLKKVRFLLLVMLSRPFSAACTFFVSVSISDSMDAFAFSSASLICLF